MPTWVEKLDPEHWLKKEFFKNSKGNVLRCRKDKDIKPSFNSFKEDEKILNASELSEIKLGKGTAKILLKPSEKYFL